MSKFIEVTLLDNTKMCICVNLITTIFDRLPNCFIGLSESNKGTSGYYVKDSYSDIIKRICEK